MNGQRHFLRKLTEHACFLVDMILLLNIHVREISSQSRYGIESLGILIGVFLIVDHGPESLAKPLIGNETVISAVPSLMTRSGSGLMLLDRFWRSSHAGSNYMRLHGS